MPMLRKEDFEYELPDERIARFPLEPRDSSKLLVFDAATEPQISHHIFRELPQFLDSSWRIFFNNTKVIPARLFFRKDSGALIEIFLLQALQPAEISQMMQARHRVSWACAVGNLKRWKNNAVLERELVTEKGKVIFRAFLTDRESQRVYFEWNTDHTFAEIIAKIGEMPLPPYLKREVQAEDISQYQTVYSQHEGAVAAPTAGLHFTPELIQKLDNQGIKIDYLTLHVGGGTFQPIKTENVLEHPMHSEQVVITRQNIANLLEGKKIVAVGTTSLRSLESLFWYGMKLEQNQETIFKIEKLFPYEIPDNEMISLEKSMKNVLAYMDRKQMDTLIGETEIMIIPSYQFRVCEALITNFHLPSTTLMMLIGAFVGSKWREIYASALANDYRFLSFGDGSLLFRTKK